MKYNRRTHEVINMAITKKTKAILKHLSGDMGLSQRAVVEVAIRLLDEQEREKAGR